MEKTEQLKSILTDLDNRELTKHQAHDLICVLFSVSKSFYCECDEPLEIQYEVGLTIYCENCGKNVKQ
jgi:hypothetical protein